jgi:hypothetical protein
VFDVTPYNRVLIWAPICSGGSFIAWLLGHEPDRIVIPDRWKAAPPAAAFEGQKVICKVTSRTPWPLKAHIRLYAPDCLLAVTRNEEAIFRSAEKRQQRNRRSRRVFGNAIGKQRRFLSELGKHRFDAVLRYEDYAAYTPQRSLYDVLRYALTHNRWCCDGFACARGRRWGVGGIRGALSAEDNRKLKRLARRL